MTEAKYPVTIMLTEEAIALLSEHGDELLSVFSAFVHQAKLSEPRIAAKAKSAAEERKQSRIIRIAQMAIDGRFAHRSLRRRMNAIRSKTTSTERSALRHKIVTEVSQEFGWQPPYAQMVIKNHRVALQAKIENRRKRYALRGLFVGLHDPEIARQLHVSTVKATRIVRELRQEAKADGVSIFDLEERYAVRPAVTGIKAQP